MGLLAAWWRHAGGAPCGPWAALVQALEIPACLTHWAACLTVAPACLTHWAAPRARCQPPAACPAAPSPVCLVAGARVRARRRTCAPAPAPAWSQVLVRWWRCHCPSPHRLQGLWVCRQLAARGQVLGAAAGGEWVRVQTQMQAHPCPQGWQWTGASLALQAQAQAQA